MNQEENINKITRSNGRSYSVRTNRDRFFYPKEWDQFYSALKDKQRFTFFFLAQTGSRINEARHVKKEDIDIQNKRLILRVTKIKAKKKEKNPRPRTIPFSNRLLTRLRAETKELNGDQCIKILSTPGANTAMKKALEKAGIQDWYMFSVHNIRKTFETWLMAIGVDGLKITAHLGHSMQVAASNYVSADVFSFEEKLKIRDFLGDLYQERRF